MGNANSGRRPSPTSRRTGERQAKAVRKQAVHVATEMARICESLPPIDFCDPEQVSARCDEYFDLCEEHDTHPTIAGIAVALGTNAAVIRGIGNGEGCTVHGKRVPDSVLRVLMKKFSLFEAIWESVFLAGGYANPVVGIFWAKNNAGYTDAREVRNTNVEVRADVASIMAKYQGAIPQHIGTNGTVARMQSAQSSKRATMLAGKAAKRLQEPVIESRAEVMEDDADNEP